MNQLVFIAGLVYAIGY